MDSYSQHGEDLLLWKLVYDWPVKCYVDVGAYDPVDMSVTKVFYDQGWRGVNVEPIADRHQRFVEHRPDELNICAVVGRHGGPRKFYESTVCPGWSTTTEHGRKRLDDALYGYVERDVFQVTLKSLLDHACYSTVGFLKIDAEGAEYEILVGNVWTGNRRPAVVMYETHLLPTAGQCAKLMEAVDYKFLVEFGGNAVWGRDDLMYFLRPRLG